MPDLPKVTDASMSIDEKIDAIVNFVSSTPRSALWSAKRRVYEQAGWEVIAALELDDPNAEQKVRLETLSKIYAGQQKRIENVMHKRHRATCDDPFVMLRFDSLGVMIYDQRYIQANARRVTRHIDANRDRYL